jgi:hypothetical protein
VLDDSAVTWMHDASIPRTTPRQGSYV